VDQVQECAADQLLPGVAEDLLHGGALVADEAVSADHRERVGRVMHQRAEALLALPKGLLCRLAFVDLLDQALVRTGERPVGPPPQRQGEYQRDGQESADGTDQHRSRLVRARSASSMEPKVISLTS
jgi:hypothetical protein